MNSFNVVSGLRRSGTSFLMLALRQSGIPIVGFKFAPYMLKKGNEVIMSTIPDNHSRKGNPNGYWEMGSITSKSGLKTEYQDMGMDGDLVKVIFDCLYFSAPAMIDKTIITMRNPRTVLMSMLEGEIIKEEEIEQAIEKSIRDTERSFEFLKEKEHFVLVYENILNNPEQEIKRACEFIGRGDYKIGARVVDKKLNREKKLIGDYKGIKELENIYNKYVK